MTHTATGRVRALLDAACAESGVPAWGFCSLAGLSRLLPGPKAAAIAPLREAGGSVILLLLPYYAGDFPGRNLSRHAMGNDYHQVAQAILSRMVDALEGAFPGRRFIPYVDSSPIPEVEAAARAGLGVRGNHCQLITRDYGSMVFLCEIVTDLPLAPEAAGELQSPDPCGGCTRCISACPTGALTGAGLNTARCRSHITQKKGVLTPWEQQQVRLGGMVWGCDICTDACPHNRRPALTPVAALREQLTPVVTRALLETLPLGEKSFGWRGPAPLLRNLALIEREAGEQPSAAEPLGQKDGEAPL